MRNVVTHIAIVVTAFFGSPYPAVMTGFARIAFSPRRTAQPDHPGRQGRRVGLAAQEFTRPAYFRARRGQHRPTTQARRRSRTWGRPAPTLRRTSTATAAIPRLERPTTPGLPRPGDAEPPRPTTVQRLVDGTPLDARGALRRAGRWARAPAAQHALEQPREAHCGALHLPGVFSVTVLAAIRDSFPKLVRGCSSRTVMFIVGSEASSRRSSSC